MTITVAGNKKEVADNLTVAQLIIDENERVLKCNAESIFII